MNRVSSLGILISTIGFSFQAYSTQSAPERYVGQWKSTAIQQMMQHQIPASITLAQGILESGSGTSMLAVKANNHFGIKCHNWEGEKIYKDDDKKNECFRVYPSADESFNDHSLFLTTRGRYASLFELDPTDYKGWAKGLKKAGYATSSTYATRLIDIIERYQLAQYDQMSWQPPALVDEKPANAAGSEIQQVIKIQSAHNVLKIQKRVKYVVAKEGDTYYRIAKEFGLGLWQLYRYNDVSEKKDMLQVGDKVYIQPKVNRSKNQKVYKVNQANESLILISQDLGIRYKALVRRNPSLNPTAPLSKGTEVLLR